MLTPEQQIMPMTGLSCTDGIVLLQLIARVSANGSIKDEELSVIGSARDSLKNALSEATGIDFDAERAKQLQIMRQAAQVQAEAEAKAEEDAKTEGGE